MIYSLIVCFFSSPLWVHLSLRCPDATTPLLSRAALFLNRFSSSHHITNHSFLARSPLYPSPSPLFRIPFPPSSPSLLLSSSPTTTAATTTTTIRSQGQELLFYGSNRLPSFFEYQESDSSTCKKSDIHLQEVD